MRFEVLQLAEMREFLLIVVSSQVMKPFFTIKSDVTKKDAIIMIVPNSRKIETFVE